MKAVQTKAAATPAKQNTSFFNKESEQSFFHSAHNEQPFFSPQKNSFFKTNHNSIQAKLTVGEPGDMYEKEADSMADKVVQRLSENKSEQAYTNGNPIQRKPVVNITSVTPFVQTKCASCEQEEKLQKKEEDDNLLDKKFQRKPIFESNAEPPDDEKNIQRKCAECEKEDEKKLQRKPNSSSTQSASPNIESSLNSSKGLGSPLPHNTREQMEDSFGADFSGVRIHNDSSSVQMNKDLHAQAFTHGSDIYFNSGKYNTSSTSGKHLLAHELTHTIQQETNLNTDSSISSLSENIIQRDIATIFPDDRPTDNQCRVFYGGRRIDHWSGWIPAMRHLYINYYKNNSDYGVLEAGPVPSTATTGGGHSGAWVKPSTWETRGVQWEITREDCPDFIDRLKAQTTTYNSCSYPYHATNGPNSNSFVWWVLHQAGEDISFLSSYYPYLHYDYWNSHTATCSTSTSTSAAATPTP